MGKLDILAFGAHPDDVELSCAGTILKHIKQGKKVGIVDLTAGELGTRGSAKLRKNEAVKAMKMMGIHARECLNLRDGFFDHNEESVVKVIKAIRKYQPHLVLANAPSDRHPDHGRASKIVSEACFYSGLSKLKTHVGNKTQESWRPQAVYHYIQDRYATPDFVIDITDFFEKKMEVILCYESQFHNPLYKGVETPISSKEFLEYLRARAVAFGRNINCKYAEGYLTERTPGVDSFFDLL